ncbi:hypothetical protein AVEN_33271-1, partial [Araneus ventricosus]
MWQKLEHLPYFTVPNIFSSIHGDGVNTLLLNFIIFESSILVSESDNISTMTLEEEMSAMKLSEIYISESGNDEAGDGTQKLPFKTVLQAMRCSGKEPFPNFYIESNKDGE